MCILKNTKDPPKNGQKNAKNGLKQDTPILGHDSDFVGGEYSKHPSKTTIIVLRKDVPIVRTHLSQNIRAICAPLHNAVVAIIK